MVEQEAVEWDSNEMVKRKDYTRQYRIFTIDA